MGEEGGTPMSRKKKRRRLHCELCDLPFDFDEDALRRHLVEAEHKARKALTDQGLWPPSACHALVYDLDFLGSLNCIVCNETITPHTGLAALHHQLTLKHLEALRRSKDAGVTPRSSRLAQLCPHCLGAKPNLSERDFLAHVNFCQARATTLADAPETSSDKEVTLIKRSENTGASVAESDLGGTLEFADALFSETNRGNLRPSKSKVENMVELTCGASTTSGELELQNSPNFSNSASTPIFEFLHQLSSAQVIKVNSELTKVLAHASKRVTPPELQHLQLEEQDLQRRFNDQTNRKPSENDELRRATLLKQLETSLKRTRAAQIQLRIESVQKEGLVSELSSSVRAILDNLLATDPLPHTEACSKMGLDDTRPDQIQSGQEETDRVLGVLDIAARRNGITVDPLPATSDWRSALESTPNAMTVDRPISPQAERLNTMNRQEGEVDPEALQLCRTPHRRTWEGFTPDAPLPPPGTPSPIPHPQSDAAEGKLLSHPSSTRRS